MAGGGDGGRWWLDAAVAVGWLDVAAAVAGCNDIGGSRSQDEGGGGGRRRW